MLPWGFFTIVGKEQPVWGRGSKTSVGRAGIKILAQPHTMPNTGGNNLEKHNLATRAFQATQCKKDVSSLIFPVLYISSLATVKLIWGQLFPVCVCVPVMEPLDTSSESSFRPDAWIYTCVQLYFPWLKKEKSGLPSLFVLFRQLRGMHDSVQQSTICYTLSTTLTSNVPVHGNVLSLQLSLEPMVCKQCMFNLCKRFPSNASMHEQGTQVCAT